MQAILKKLIYSELINTLMFAIVFGMIIPITLYTRGWLQQTKILSMLIIWFQRNSLVHNNIHKQLKLLRAIKSWKPLIRSGFFSTNFLKNKKGFHSCKEAN